MCLFVLYVLLVAQQSVNSLFLFLVVFSSTRPNRKACFCGPEYILQGARPSCKLSNYTLAGAILSSRFNWPATLHHRGPDRDKQPKVPRSRRLRGR